MDVEKRNEIEKKLRKLIEMSVKQKSTEEIPQMDRPVCNVIRRRKGQQDKRIYVAMSG
ncbi:MAG: hypothetical protein V2I97_12365 [Desulfococcaceae bacterium]|jgi:hypothetical protein|nr:hypothetical protein [Desulfococcaceae bacterium]